MTDRLAEIAHVYAARLLNVLLALAFLLIPVRCDAASAAHSIFLTPAESGVAVDGGHRHSGAATSHQHDTQGKAAPSKDMTAQHAAVESDPFLCGDEVTTTQTSVATEHPADPGETDAKSQSPLGATLYLPIPTTLQIFELTPSLEIEQRLELPPPAGLVSAELISPEPPPPKSTHR